MKSQIKKVVPGAVWKSLSRIRRVLDRAGLMISDSRRFSRYYSKSPAARDFQQLCARMTFHAHSLEKGLSHTKLRLGFGESALIMLAITMDQYISLRYDRSSPAYVNALSVLAAYLQAHVEHVDATERVKRLFGKHYEAILSCTSSLGGVVSVSAEDKASNRSKSFDELFLGRTSVREYSDEKVDLAAIEEAIQISTKSPSICNRQAYRVRVLTEREEIAAALAIQTGMNGYATPPVLLVVTTDIRNFIAPTERNQTYVDGGIFAMSLLLSLEFVGLAACPLNTMFGRRKERRARSLLGITHENFIMFIAVGGFPAEVKAPKSFRYAASDIVVPGSARQ